MAFSYLSAISPGIPSPSPFISLKAVVLSLLKNSVLYLIALLTSCLIDSSIETSLFELITLANILESLSAKPEPINLFL